MTEDLRHRFEQLRPELEQRAAELVANLAEPRPTIAALVEATWQIVCSRRKLDVTRAAVLRELESSIHNLVLRDRISAGELDAAFAYLYPHLRAWAGNLSRGLPSPQPDPDDLVQDAFLKLRRAPMFLAVDNPLGYAFRAVKNLVIDHARRTRRTVEVAERHLPTAELETSPERLEAIARRAGLSAEERCMVFRVVFERLAVGAAQQECGGPSGAPYYVLEKIYDKLASAFGVERKRS